MILSARQVASHVFIVDVSRCEPTILTASHGPIECLAYDYPSWHNAQPSYAGDFELIKPGDALILLPAQGLPVPARVSTVLLDADGDGEPVRILIGKRCGG